MKEVHIPIPDDPRAGDLLITRLHAWVLTSDHHGSPYYRCHFCGGKTTVPAIEGGCTGVTLVRKP